MADRVPGARLLWEDGDAGTILRERFGFDEPAEVAGWLDATVRTTVGLGVDSCGEVVISAGNALVWFRSGDRRLIAKWSAVPLLFARLREAAAVTAHLATQGVPVVVPLRGRDGALLAEVDGPRPPYRFLLGVLPVVEGDLLDVSAPAQVRDAGRLLATIHTTLASCDLAIDGQRPGDGRQLVHFDYRAANLLHDGTGIVAVLDLEELAVATRTEDLARAAVVLGRRAARLVQAQRGEDPLAQQRGQVLAGGDGQHPTQRHEAEVRVAVLARAGLDGLQGGEQVLGGVAGVGIAPVVDRRLQVGGQAGQAAALRRQLQRDPFP